MQRIKIVLRLNQKDMFKITRSILASFAFALLAMLSSPIFAQSSINNPLLTSDSISKQSLLIKKALNLDEVVVTGTRTPKTYSKSPVLTKLITSKNLQTAGTISLQEALLENVAGLMTDDNAMGSNLKLRGLNSRYILFMLDGQPMLKEGSSGNVDLNQINIDDIDHIEYLSGAASALYGSNAVGAVINFISKQKTEKWSAGLNAANGSNNTKRMSVSLSTNNRISSIQWSGFRSSADAFGDPYVTNSQYAYLNYGTSLAWKLHPSTSWDAQVKGSFYQNKTYDVIDERGQIMNSQKRKFNSSVVVNWYSLDKKNILNLSGNYQLYDTYANYASLGNKKQKELEATIYKTELLDTYTPNETLQVVSGLGYDYKDAWSQSIFGTNPTRQSVEESHALAQADWTPLTFLTVVGGMRYTHNQSFGSSIDPKISLMYTLNHWKIRTGFSTAFRAPSIRELYYDFYHGPTFHIVGNPSLDAEKGKYCSASIEYTHGHFNGSITGFYNKITDKIDGNYTMNQGNMRYSYVNISRATMKGFDIDTSWAINTQWLLKGNYSYCDASNEDTGSQLQSNMKHAGNASVVWNPSLLGEPMSFLVSGRFSSAQQYDRMGTDAQTGREMLITSYSKPYKIIKITYTKPFKIARQTLKLSLKVDNLFNFEDATYKSSGRTFTLGISYHIH